MKKLIIAAMLIVVCASVSEACCRKPLRNGLKAAKKAIACRCCCK